MEMDYKKQIEQILKDSKEEIKTKTTEAIKEKIISELNYSIGKDISDIVTTTIKEDLEKEIKALVIDCKQEILDGIKPAFANVGAEIAKTLEAKTIENLQSSWKSSQIIESILK